MSGNLSSFSSFTTYTWSDGLSTSISTSTYKLWPTGGYVEPVEDTKARQKSARRAEEPPPRPNMKKRFVRG